MTSGMRFLEGKIEITFSTFRFLLGYLFIIPATLVAFTIEKLAARPSFPRKLIWIFVALNIMFILAFPIWFINEDIDFGKFNFTNDVIGNRMLLLGEACIFAMKFLSYHHVYHDLRYHLIKGNKIQESNKQNTKFGRSKSVDYSNASNLPKTENRHRKQATFKITEIEDKLSLNQSLIEQIQMYPNNISFSHLLYFICIPTLCF